MPLLPNDLLPFMARVGTGPTGSKDLSYDEARAAMAAILAGRYDPVTLGAFLLALRWKPEAPEELAGFLDTLREASLEEYPPPPEAPANLVDAAANYDGKRETPNVAIPAALVATGAGVPLILHDGEEIPTKYGVTKYHVLRALGVAVGATPAQARRCLAEVGIAYLHQPAFSPALVRLLPARQAVGKRTFLNVVEPLVNPLGAPVHVGGIFHLPFAERVIRALARSRAGFRRAVIVQGLEGSDELPLGRRKVAEWREGELLTYEVDSTGLGLGDSAQALRGPGEADAGHCAARIVRLLEEPAPGPFHDMVLLNAALRLYASGLAATLGEGLEAARESLYSGRAAGILGAWRAWSPARAGDPAGPVPARLGE